MNKIFIAKIVKAQGIKGEVKLTVETNDLSRFLLYKSLYVDGIEMRVVTSRIDSTCAYVLFDGIADRNGAEKLVGKDVFVEESLMPKLPKNSYYVKDLEKCDLCFSDGERFASVKEVLCGVRDDVIYANDMSGKGIAFPMVRGVVERIDLTGELIYLNKQVFEEVSFEY